MKDMKSKILFFLMLSSVLFESCKTENEESLVGEAVVLKTSIQQVQSANPSSRIVTNNNWLGMTDKRIAVSVDGVVKEYSVDDEGTATAVDPFYWEANQELTLNMWYPYNEGAYSESVIVKSDQSDNNNFILSDCIEAVQVKVTKDAPNVVLNHRTAKLIFKFYPNESGYKNKLVYDNLIGVENDAKEVIFNPSNEALVAPQVLKAGEAVLKVFMNNRWVKFGVISEDADVELKAGMSHVFKVDVDKVEGVKITFEGTNEWNYTEEEINGNSPVVGNGTNSTNDWGIETGTIVGTVQNEEQGE